MTLYLKRKNLEERDKGFRFLFEDDYNGLYISQSSNNNKRFELETDDYELHKIIVNIYVDDIYVGRLTGIARIENYDGEEVEIK